MEYLWTWEGKFFGYSCSKLLYTYNGKCVGHFVGKIIYDQYGNYLGELMNVNRLIASQSKKHWRGPPAPHINGSAIVRLADYAGYVMLAGYEDFPSPDEF